VKMEMLDIFLFIATSVGGSDNQKVKDPCVKGGTYDQSGIQTLDSFSHWFMGRFRVSGLG
jgi:hypothetical protein